MRSIEEFFHWEKVSRETIDFKMVYVDIAGDLIAGLLLSQIIYWNLPSKDGKSKLSTIRGKKVLVKKRSDWFEEIRITEKQYDRAIAILEKKRIVKVENHKSSFYEGSTVPHIELRNTWLLAHLNIQSRKAGLTKRKSLNKQRGISRIDKKVNAIDTEITSKNTTENTNSKKESIPENKPLQEIEIQLPKSLSKQLQELAETNNIPYTEDIRQDNNFHSKLMMEIKNCTNDKILERAKQFVAIAKRDKKPEWVKTSKLGFKTLKFKWDDIEMEYNKDRPSNVTPFPTKKEPIRPTYDEKNVEEFMRSFK